MFDGTYFGFTERVTEKKKMDDIVTFDDSISIPVCSVGFDISRVKEALEKIGYKWDHAKTRTSRRIKQVKENIVGTIFLMVAGRALGAIMA